MAETPRGFKAQAMFGWDAFQQAALQHAAAVSIPLMRLVTASLSAFPATEEVIAPTWGRWGSAAIYMGCTN